MKDCGISGIAVINKERKLITSLSATDFLYLEPENFDYLSLGIKSFLYKVRGFIQQPICCSIDDTLETLFFKMVHHNVHRIFIVDDEFKPIGIITLTDIMNFLCV